MVVTLELGLLLKLASPLDTKSVGEDVANVLESHALDLWVAEVDAWEAAEEADGGVEAKGTGRGGVFHLGQESGSDNDVGAPAGHGEHHGAHGANLHGEEFRGQPGGVSHSGAVEADVADHADKDDNGGCTDVGSWNKSQVVADWDPVEGDSGDNEEETHEWHGAEQNAAATNAIDEHQVDPGEEEVCACNDCSDCDGVGESDEGKEGGRVVPDGLSALKFAFQEEETYMSELKPPS